MAPAPRILVVDDHPLNVKLVRVLLTTAGYDIATASDAGEAMDALAGELPGLILMDLQLPGVDGFELTRRMKAVPAFAVIPIVALTATAIDGDAERARAAGCAGFIAKPIDTQQLVARVGAFLPLPAAT